jgi:hypothetical protein
MEYAVDELGKLGVSLHQPGELADDEKGFGNGTNGEETLEEQYFLVGWVR